MTNRNALAAGVLGMAGLGVLAGPAAAQTSVMLEPSKDNSLYEDPNGAISNGRGVSLVSGQTLFAGRRRALLAFDVGGAVPAGAMITSASLTLTITRFPPGAPDVVAALHRLSVDWGEGTSNDPGAGGAGAQATLGDATWQHNFFETDLWTNDGGDFAATASDSAAIIGTASSVTWSGPGVLADVQSWHAAPGANFGWIVLVDESSTGAARRFDSREALTPGTRPRLAVTFAPACAPDFNGDGNLDPDDLSDYITCFFTNALTPGSCLEADYSGDGNIDPDDLSDYITAFFAGC